MGKNITIIGLGLIGGSLAKAIKSKCENYHICAIDNSVKTINLAIKQGIIDKGYTSINNAISNSDFIFIATPVNYAIDYIKKILPYTQKDCIISDLCSTKTEILNKAEVESIKFIGGHPMAGSEKSGFTNSSKNMFENAYYVLVPCKNADKTDLEKLTELIKQIGAIPIVMDAKNHDFAVAAISHLPHVAACCLVNNIKDESDKKIKLAAGGFREITRIASSDANLWQSIFFSNKNALMYMLERYISLLKKFYELLKNDNKEEIINFLNSSKTIRDNLDKSIKGLIPSSYILYSDVEDKPGVIGRVANLLSENGINIKNISILNSREYEGGILSIVFYDKNEYLLAKEVMQKNQYKVIER